MDLFLRDRVMGRKGGGGGWCVPGAAWLILWVLMPLGLVVGMGFLSRGEYGGVERPWTWANYLRLAGVDELGFDPLYPQVLGRTLAVALLVTGLTLVTALPMAFFLARLGPRGRMWGMTLVVVPFWTNLLIRTYGWQLLLSAGGPLPWLGSWLGMGEPGAAWYPGWGAVVLVMWGDFLPFMVLPVYAAVERMDGRLLEAAADLGANRWQVFREAIWPQILPGVGSGVLMVFLPATGQFVIPDLLGGGQTTLWGNLIQQQFGSSRDWPMGAAAATVLLVIMVLVVGVGRWRWGRVGEGGGD